MAIYWHPFLAQFLRQDYGDRLIIQEEVPLGEMPPRADLILIRRDPQVKLPFPFSHLGETTLVEYKGPGRRAGQEELVQLEIYGLLYQLREKRWDRAKLTLWLLASGFQRTISRKRGAYLRQERKVGAGVRGGRMDEFPAFLLDLTELPIERATLPLVMVSKGRQEREVVEYVIDHVAECAAYLQPLLLLHAPMVKEVLTMRQMTPEEVGVDLKSIVSLFGEDRVIEALGGMENVFRLWSERLRQRRIRPEEMGIDLKSIVSLFGEDRVIEAIGPERVRELLEQMAQKETAEKSPSPSP